MIERQLFFIHINTYILIIHINAYTLIIHKLHINTLGLHNATFLKPHDMCCMPYVALTEFLFNPTL